MTEETSGNSQTNSTAVKALTDYIVRTTDTNEYHTRARSDAEEFGLSYPDEPTGQLLSTLAALSVSESNQAGIAATPASGIVGLYLLDGLGPDGHLTCIDPESEHQSNAKDVFRAAGYTQFRFLPSRPLEVMGRLAPNSYRIVVGDLSSPDLPAFIDLAWPLLQPGGILVLLDCLYDGLLTDPSDRDMAAAREADEKIRALDDALVSRLPLGSGVTLAVKR